MTRMETVRITFDHHAKNGFGSGIVSDCVVCLCLVATVAGAVCRLAFNSIDRSVTIRYSNRNTIIIYYHDAVAVGGCCGTLFVHSS